MANLVIVGDGETAELAYQYFTHDSEHDVIAFCVEREYATRERLFDLPVVHFEEVARLYPPVDYKAFVAIWYTQLNRVRRRLYEEAKGKGYQCVSYVSSRAFVWRNAEIGDNCFILENNVVQYAVKLGNDVVLWSGNHIGHRTVIGNHVFVSSHVVISGYCDIGEHCFLGVNSSIVDHITIADDCLVGAGAVIHKDTKAQTVYAGNPAKPIGDSFTAFGVQVEGA